MPRFSFPRGVACALPAAQEPGNRRLWPCVLQGAKLLSPAEKVKFFKRDREWPAVISAAVSGEARQGVARPVGTACLVVKRASGRNRL